MNLRAFLIRFRYTVQVEPMRTDIKIVREIRFNRFPSVNREVVAYYPSPFSKLTLKLGLKFRVARSG